MSEDIFHIEYRHTICRSSITVAAIADVLSELRLMHWTEYRYAVWQAAAGEPSLRIFNHELEAQNQIRANFYIFENEEKDERQLQQNEVAPVNR